MHEPEASAHLQHHFETPAQQFDSAKLGMWLFLATEILLFGGLFCAYAVYRGNHPEVFLWAHHLLDTKLGAVNTVVLLTSSLTMAWAVRCAQLDQRRGLMILLALTLLGGFTFMGVKYAEYEAKWKHGLLWGKNFGPDEGYLAEHFGVAEHDAGSAERGPDPGQGQRVYLGSCYGCHGIEGEGIAGQGPTLRSSTLVAGKEDAELLQFLTADGRPPAAPGSPPSHLRLPPHGGNPALGPRELADVVVYLRVLQDEYRAAGGTVAAAPSPAPGSETPATSLPERSVIRSAPAGPAGRAEDLGIRAIPAPPSNVHIFFGIYFLMTGLHGLHVLAGMGVLSWLLVRAARGEFGSTYFTPVDLGGLYWHLVDLIWIFLFPLLYLIH